MGPEIHDRELFMSPESLRNTANVSPAVKLLIDSIHFKNDEWLTAAS